MPVVRGKGLSSVLSRRYNIPVYASPKTWDQLACIGEIPDHNKREYEYGMEIEGLKLEFFKTCHDAVQPVGIAFHHGNSHLGIATDTGCVTRGIKKALTGADTVIFEANHDEQMLKQGPYPYYLKKRIAGDEGHLSNRTAAKSLTEIVTGKTQHIVLAHLSQVNNTPNVAFNSVAATLDEADILNSVDLTVAPRYQAHQVIKIKRL